MPERTFRLGGRAGLKTSQENVAAWSGDVWGGLAAMLVALPASIAFGVSVYAAAGPESAGAGALVGVIGAAVLGITAPLIARSRGLISAPCAPAAAVLAALAAQLSLAAPSLGMHPAQVPLLLAITGVFAACLQAVYGIVGGGRLIKFIPYQVVSGYMTGVAIIIMLGQLPKLLGLSTGVPLFTGLAMPQAWNPESLAIGGITILSMLAAPRITQRIPATIAGLAAGVAGYFALACLNPALLTLEGNPLLIGPLQLPADFVGGLGLRLESLVSLSGDAIAHLLVPAVTLSLLLSVDTLKTCVVLDAITLNRHNANRELIGQGIGNALASLAGGMPGAGTMGATLVNVSSGGSGPRSAVIAGGLSLVALLLLRDLIAWLPLPVLAGILMVVAWRMVDKSMLRLLRHPSGRIDFLVITGVIVVAVTVNLVAASAVGVLFAILLFIRARMNEQVIRRKRYIHEAPSNTQRSPAEREVLARLGHEAVVCELQGDLFFGTADKLFTLIEADIKAARFILFDMRRVHSMDFTAAHQISQIQSMLERRGGRLLFSGMPTTTSDGGHFEADLAKLDVIRDRGGALVSDTMDGAQEWMEERLLESEAIDGPVEEVLLLDVKEFPLFAGLGYAAHEALRACMQEVSFSAGQRIVSAGESGDAMYFLRRGRAIALLPLAGDKRHHLATFGPGDFFGELSFMDGSTRTSDVEARLHTDLYALRRADFDAQVERLGEPSAGEIFARLALILAKRLREYDTELRVLEER
jgi:SulP family sulfate permease